MAVPIPPFNLGERLLQQWSFHLETRRLSVDAMDAAVQFQDFVQDMDRIVD